jgi:two-component system CheB/CheR fusion protein
MIALLLQAQGAETRCAYTGADGLEQARSWKPQVALLDVGLPDMSGHQLASRLRAEQGGGSLLLVAVTGFGDPGVERKALASGFDARLIKPVDHGTLQRLIAEHLRQAT